MTDIPSSISATVVPNPRRGLIILAFGIVLLVTLLQVLPFSRKENLGLGLLVFIGLLWLTEAVHITVTALLIPMMAVGMGLLEVNKALVSFADPIIVLFFGGFALATALHIQGLDKLIASRILILAKGKLSHAALLLFATTAGLSMWISNTATVAMMLPLAIGILSKLDQDREHNTYVFILLGIAYSASIGGVGTLVGSPPNAIAAAQLGLDFNGWMKIGLPIMLLLMPLMVLLLYVIFRPNLKQQVATKLELIEWKVPHVVTLIIFGLTVFCWIFSHQISGLLGGIKQFDSLVALSAVILIGVSGVASWKQIQQHTEWGILILFGAGLTLSTILKDSGASAVMARGILHLFGQSHWFVIVLVVATFIVFLTEFTSNTASAALLVPIFATVSDTLGMSPILLTLVIGIGASCAFMLPVATPPNAIVFASGNIRQIEMLKAGIYLNVLCIITISVFAWFFWR